MLLNFFKQNKTTTKVKLPMWISVFYGTKKSKKRRPKKELIFLKDR